MGGTKDKAANIQIQDCMNQLLLCGHDRRNTKAYEEFAYALKNVVEKIHPYYQKDKDGKYKELAGEQLEGVKNVYQEAIEKAAAFAAAAGNDKHAEGMRYISGKISKVLEEEFKGLSDVMPGDKVILPTLSEKINTHVVELDQNLNADSVGGHLSNRIPISYTAPDGRVVKGFFTENSTLDVKKETEDLITRMAQGNETYEKALHQLVASNDYEHVFGGASNPEEMMFIKKSLVANGLIKPIEMFSMVLSRGISDGEVKDAVMKDEYFPVLLSDFSVAYSRMRLKNTFVPETGKIAPGSQIEVRNAAMSAVADLIGMPKVLARSVPMEVRAGGESKKGVFMEFAQGSETDALKANDPLFTTLSEETKQPRFSPQALADLADLQVVDYICANIDRHPGNMMFQVGEFDGKSCVTGVVGIDNDCSFGAVEPSGQNQIHMVAPEHMGFVTRKTADRVLALTEESLQTILKGRGLSDAEIKASWNRTKHLQEQLTLAMGPHKDRAAIKIVDSMSTKADMEAVNSIIAREPASYFAKASARIRTSLKNAGEITEQQKVQEKLEEKYPVFKKKKSGGMQIGKMHGIDAGAEKTFAANKAESDYRLSTLAGELKTADTGWFIGSKKFHNMRAALNETLRLENTLSGLGDHAKPANYKQTKDSYQTLIEQTKIYLARKEKQELDNLKKGKAPDENSQKRTAFAKEVLAFANQRLEVLAGMETEIKEARAAAIRTIESTNEITRQTLSIQSEGPDAKNEYRSQVRSYAKLFVGMSLIDRLRHGNNLSKAEIQEHITNRTSKDMVTLISGKEEFKNQVLKMDAADFKKAADDPAVLKANYDTFTKKILGGKNKTNVANAAEMNAKKKAPKGAARNK